MRKANRKDEMMRITQSSGGAADGFCANPFLVCAL